jgi:hypothetical protein
MSPTTKLKQWPWHRLRELQTGGRTMSNSSGKKHWLAKIFGGRLHPKADSFFEFLLNNHRAKKLYQKMRKEMIRDGLWKGD